MAMARYVLPVPAGPMPKVTSWARIASTYFFCPTVLGDHRRFARRGDDSFGVERAQRGDALVFDHVERLGEFAIAHRAAVFQRAFSDETSPWPVPSFGGAFELDPIFARDGFDAQFFLPAPGDCAVRC